MRQVVYDGRRYFEGAFNFLRRGATGRAGRPVEPPSTRPPITPPPLMPPLPAAAPPRQRASGPRHWTQQFDRLFLLHASDRCTALEGLRGAACLMVFALHALMWQAAPNFAAASRSVGGILVHFLRGGSTGVDIFFALSGFLIVWTNARPAPSGTARRFDAGLFMERRFARLMPVHLLVLAPILLWMGGYKRTLWMVPLVVLLLATRRLVSRSPRASAAVGRTASVLWRVLALAWVVGGVILAIPALRYTLAADFLANAMCLAYFTRDIPVRNPVTWSLSVEYLFYFGFVAFVLATRRVPARWKGGLVVTLFVAIVLLNTAIADALARWGLYAVPAGRAIAFLGGIAVAALYGNTKLWSKISGTLVPLSAVATVVVVALVYLMPGWNDLGFYLAFDCAVACMLAGLLLPRSLPRLLLDNRFFRFFGAISYSFYLIHAPLMFVAGRVVPAQTAALPVCLTILVTLGLSAGVAVGAYVLFERPYLAAQLARKTARTTPPVAETTSGTAVTPVPAPAGVTAYAGPDFVADSAAAFPNSAKPRPGPRRGADFDWPSESPDEAPDGPNNSGLAHGRSRERPVPSELARPAAPAHPATTA